MKICVVNQHYSRSLGGSEIQCHLLAKELSHRGHDVTYMALGGCDLGDLPYDVVQLAPLNPLSLNLHLSRPLMKIKPDIVYWRANRPGFASVALPLRLARINMVFGVSAPRDLRLNWQRSNSLSHGRLLGTALALENRIGYRALGLPRAITVMNRSFLNESHRDIHYVPNSMLSDAVPFEWDRPFCVWISNLKAHKRPEVFIRAAAALKDLPIDFLMVGRVADDKYSYVADPTQVSPNFHFLGSRTLAEVNGILARAEVLAHTCEPEGFPNVFLQAWQVGTPTITLEYDPEGLIDAHDLGGNARGDEDLFVDLIRDRLDSRDELMAMGSRAQELFMSRFTTERSADALESLLFDVVQHNKHEMPA